MVLEHVRQKGGLAGPQEATEDGDGEQGLPGRCAMARSRLGEHSAKNPYKTLEEKPGFGV